MTVDLRPWTFVLLLILSACTRQPGTTQQALRTMAAQYPQATLQDVYKSFYQDRFGPGHLIADTASAHAWLIREIHEAAEDTVATLYYEPTGAEGRYVRVYLRCVTEGKISANQLFTAFLQSAAESPRFLGDREESWSSAWVLLSSQAREVGFTCPDSVAAELNLAAQTCRPVRHSDRYRQTYHPHYRIVERAIFEKDILPRL